MKYKILLPLAFTFSIGLITSCKPNAKNDTKEPVTQDTTQKTKDTSIVQNKDSVNHQTEEKVDPALKGYIENAHKEFDQVPSSFEAKYLGYDMGDYPHITFKDKNGKEYDFGDGANSFGTFKEEDFLAEKSKYEGKTFKLTWEWKTSSFYCCDGEMTVRTGKVPSITNLELVK